MYSSNDGHVEILKADNQLQKWRTRVSALHGWLRDSGEQISFLHDGSHVLRCREMK
jgi:hypothetical protein